MDERAKSPPRLLWLTGPKAGQVEPPWPEERPITPAMEKLVYALAHKAATDVLNAQPIRLASERPLRLPAVIDRVGLSRSTIYDRVAAGTFPKPVSDGTVSRWFESEINAYIDDLRTHRSAGE